MSEISPPQVMTGSACPLISALTTLEIGGRPHFYAKVTTETEALIVARWAKSQGLKLWMIGGGSNVVVDHNVPKGLFIQLALRQIDWGEDKSSSMESGIIEQRVTLGAGVVWTDFVEESVQRGLAGVECLVGIPGWVGAAPIQNIGAYGQSLSDRCLGVKVYDIERDLVDSWSAERCSFAYRDSLFKRSEGRYIILEVTLSLTRGGAPTLHYPQLRDRLDEAGCGADPTLMEVCDMVKRVRAEKSMLWTADDPNRRSVGSFFMNPVLSPASMKALDVRCQQREVTSPPRWSTEVGFKVPAAWLIEQSGLSKGYTQGRVGLSSKHCLALISHGGASYNDMLSFAEEVQRRVWSLFRVWLEPEARILSDAPSPLSFSPRIALATCDSLPDWEVDDRPLWSALSAEGFQLVHPAWDDPLFDWGACDLVIPRTTWDYQGKWRAFLEWMERVDQVSTLSNPLELMKWNLDKRYLRDLAISQPPTHWLSQRALDEGTLDETVSEVIGYCTSQGWERAFLKPSVGASAIGTLRFSLSDSMFKMQLRDHLATWLPKRTMILQPYVEGVEVVGECSLIYFGGEFSHGVRKVPVSGDYRVQDDYGATDMPWTPPPEWRVACQELIARLPQAPLYARCDLLHGPNDSPWLIELELIEPSLFFRHNLDSPQRFARAIKQHLQFVDRK